MSDLTSHLIKIDELAKVCAFGLEVLYYSRKSIPSNTTLEVLQKSTSAEEPLVVRYPLSNNTSRSFYFFLPVLRVVSAFLTSWPYIVLAKVRFLGSTAKICLPHTTGAWHRLLAETQANFIRLQENTKELNDIYFVDQETKKKIIDIEFTFMHLVKYINPSPRGWLLINLSVRIKGLVEY